MALSVGELIKLLELQRQDNEVVLEDDTPILQVEEGILSENGEKKLVTYLQTNDSLPDHITFYADIDSYISSHSDPGSPNVDHDMKQWATQYFLKLKETEDPYRKGFYLIMGIMKTDDSVEFKAGRIQAILEGFKEAKVWEKTLSYYK
ncbi:hypothetical protein [Paenibacillus jiagnxiensis]|uniref:hypothetical protein n=1 Tax=Paenibacillus jiagnxiensis TaxID=3228926 RepID=UPI0033BEF6A3